MMHLAPALWMPFLNEVTVSICRYDAQEHYTEEQPIFLSGFLKSSGRHIFVSLIYKKPNYR